MTEYNIQLILSWPTLSVNKPFSAFLNIYVKQHFFLYCD